MDHTEVAPQTCVLKMNVKCGNCQKRVQKTLQRIHGVHSINIDANEGKVTLSTSVDPQVLIQMITEAGKAAQLLWVQKPQVNKQNYVEHPNIKNVPINDAPAGNDKPNGIDYQKLNIEQLQEFAKIKGLKNMEIDHHRNIKLNFKDHDEDLIHKTDHKMKMVMDDVQGPQMQNGAANGKNAPLANGGCAHQCGNGNGSSSSGGGGGGGCNGHVKTNMPHCDNHIEFTFAGPSWVGNRYVEGTMKPATYYASIAKPALAHHGHPFAPPPPNYVPQGLPSGNYPNADIYCDDTLNACSVM